MYPPAASGNLREAVPVPPLNPKHTMPVPPPTLPSAIGPLRAVFSAASACSGLTWKAFMSFSQPSAVSATTGMDQRCTSASCSTSQAMMVSRTMPTLCVLVRPTAPSMKPPSSIQAAPVISPLPFNACQPANTG